MMRIMAGGLVHLRMMFFLNNDFVRFTFLVSTALLLRSCRIAIPQWRC